jgi:type II restriction enzyme
LNKVDELFYPIVKIIRDESGGNYEYELKGDLVFVSGEAEKIRIPVKVFQEKAILLLQDIKKSKGVFRLTEFEEFLSSVNCHSLKAKSTKKTDIRIIIHDLRLNQQVELGFSIKSQLGGDSTLLNAGKTTNFIYQLQNFNPSPGELKSINSIDTKSKIKDRLDEIKKMGGKLKFASLEQDIFKNNLVLIDSLLPNILAEAVKVFYTTSLCSIKDLTKDVNDKNPLNYDKQFLHSFYEYKIKRFLTDVALGMMPSKVWGGIYDTTGGYLIVKENGDVLCYHIYNRNQFEDYLFYNTKLETASSTRHEFGKIYIANDQYFFKLNLQIRFI